MTEGVDLERCGPDDIEALTAFLGEVDLTRSGLDAASVRLWLAHDGAGVIVGSTGYEISGDGDHALIRSVAVSADQRSRGRGSALATFALARAAEEGARAALRYPLTANGGTLANTIDLRVAAASWLGTARLLDPAVLLPAAAAVEEEPAGPLTWSYDGGASEGWVVFCVDICVVSMWVKWWWVDGG